MIKGCEKRVVWVRNTESDIFEQAYFILSESACEKKKSDGDIVSEAKRIIGQLPITGLYEPPSAKTKKRRRSPASVKIGFFVIGFVLGAIPPALVLLLL